MQHGRPSGKLDTTWKLAPHPSASLSSRDYRRTLEEEQRRHRNQRSNHNGAQGMGQSSSPHSEAAIIPSIMPGVIPGRVLIKRVGSAPGATPQVQGNTSSLRRCPSCGCGPGSPIGSATKSGQGCALARQRSAKSPQCRCFPRPASSVSNRFWTLALWL